VAAAQRLSSTLDLPQRPAVPAWPTKVGRPPSSALGFAWGRRRFRLIRFLRLLSRPAYYAYPLGDEARLSAEIMPVRVR
jgi:hypothetical protein